MWVYSHELKVIENYQTSRNKIYIVTGHAFFKLKFVERDHECFENKTSSVWSKLIDTYQ